MRGLTRAAAAALLLALPAFAGAQPPAKPKRQPKVLPGDDIQLKTKDGWTLAAKYSAAQLGQNSFVLLHGAGGRKEDWYYLAKAMAHKGLGVLAVDLRGHGASQTPPPGRPTPWRKFIVTKDDNEWNNMILDVDAAVEFLKSSGVAPTGIALGGADVGASIALKYAAVHPQVPMLFMLSPGMSYREVLTVNAIRAYTKRPILMVVGADDARSVRETAILFSFAQHSAGPENTVKFDAEREHGTKMLAVNKGLITKLLDWFENPTAPPALPAISTETTPEGLPTDQQLGVGGSTGTVVEPSDDLGMPGDNNPAPQQPE